MATSRSAIRRGTTRRSTTQPGFFDGPDWPSDSSSDFDADSRPASPDSSSGYESVISDDLDLCEPRYVR
jgi:hypothetical protein